MESLLIYLLRSAVCLGILYFIWWLFMSKDTFFAINRYYLLSSVFLSLLIPLFNFPFITPVGKISTSLVLQAITVKPEQVQNAYITNISVFQVILVVYFTGVGIFAIRFFIQLFQLIRLIKLYGVTEKEGLKFVFTDSNYAPFSFYGRIFVNSKFDSKDMEQIVAHEKVHIEQKHSYDLLLLEILTIVHWFNPFTWFYRSSIKSIHEYLADEGVLRKGISRINYQELLLSLSLGIQVNDLTNNIHKSLIKRRFAKMLQEKTTIYSSLKYILILPFAFIVLLAFGMNDPAMNISNFNTNDTVYTKTDVEASFVGGAKELQQFLLKNVKYPEECRKDNIEGIVVVSFLVKSNGKIDNIEIANSVHPLLDKESIRVVSLMPDWIPGKMNGNLVNVKLSIPFKYTLGN